MSERNMRHYRPKQKSCLLFKDRNEVVTYKCVVLVALGERHESLQIMLPRNEVAGCLCVITCRCGHSKS